MGSVSVKFEAESESPSGSGAKCALSRPIEGVTAAEFWGLLDRYLRTRRASKRHYETAYEARELGDGGIATAVTYGSSGFAAFLGEQRCTAHTVYYVCPEKDEMRSHFYQTDATLKESSLLSETTLKAHKDPFRLEMVAHQRSVRCSGDAVSSVLAQIVKDLGLGVETFADAASPTEEGKLSALTGHILSEPALTTEAFWARWKEHLLRSGGRALDDGSVVVELSGWQSTKVYSTVQLRSEDGLVVSEDHGTDESRRAVTGRSYQRILSDPARLEMFYVTAESRGSGSDVAALADAFISDVLKFARKTQK